MRKELYRSSSLPKYTLAEKRNKVNGNCRQQRITGNMRLTTTCTGFTPRMARKTVKGGYGVKRPAPAQIRHLPVKGKEERLLAPLDSCDNSNDSGLGFDHHVDPCVLPAPPALRLAEREQLWELPEPKRKRLDIKLESDDANANFSFSHAMSRSHKTAGQPGGLNPPHCMLEAAVSGARGGLSMAPPSGGVVSASPGVVAAPPPAPAPAPVRAQPPPPATARPPGGGGRVGGGGPGSGPGGGARRSPASLSTQLANATRDGRVQLQITAQPEQQHRARYQTEGSRGAVKDRSGNGFPVVRLIGYNKPATLQVFIGTDVGRVAPHMFYQACKVSGKNSTPCMEKKIDGTIVIEVDFDPAKDMTITCDCVGILKERNVDVEHRFPDQTGARNKKKSTRCRMVFRTTVTLPDGSTEILQTTSQPIVCTQPPGVPEICKKSLSVCLCTGGMELFILGKNFLKDTRVVFQQNDIDPVWEETVQPDKEFLQQTHLVCTVPAYHRLDIIEPVTVRLLVTSSGKTSEPHSFTYTPATTPVLPPAVGTTDLAQSCLALPHPTVTQGAVDVNRAFSKPHLGPPPGLLLPATPPKPTAAVLPNLPSQFMPVEAPGARMKKDVHPVRLWSSVPLVADPAKGEACKAPDEEQGKGLKMMPPPLLPISGRRPSAIRLIIPDSEVSSEMATELKSEIIDEPSQGSTQLSPEDLKGIDLRMKPVVPGMPIATVSDLLSTQSPSLATLRRFVSNPGDAPLPTQSVASVEKYLSHIENAPTAKTVAGVGPGVTLPETATSVSTGTTSTPMQDLGLNKLRTCEKALGPQFVPSFVFGTPQGPQGGGLLAPALGAAPGDDVAMSMFTSAAGAAAAAAVAAAAEKEQQKVEQATIQEAMATRALLAADLNSVVANNQSKSEFRDNAQTSPVSVLRGSPNRMSVIAASTTSNNSLNMQTTPVAMSRTLHSVTEPQSMITATPNSRLDALVSSAIESRILEANQHAQAEEKINVFSAGGNLIGSVPAANLPSPVHVSITSASMGANEANSPSQLMTSQDLRLDEALTPALAPALTSVAPIADFPMSTLSSAQRSVQITQESIIMNNSVTTAFNDRVLTSEPASKRSEEMVLDQIPDRGLAMDTAIVTHSSPQSQMMSPTRTSPIAMKSIMMTTSNVSGAETLMVTSPALSPPMTGKNIMNSSPLVETHLQSANRTSPIAVKTMMLESPETKAEVMNNGMKVKDILTTTAVDTTIPLATSPICTSPIAVKKMILESTATVAQEVSPSTSTQAAIAVKNILNSQLTETSLIPSTAPDTPLTTEKLDALVESTMSSHMLTSSSVEPVAATASMSLQPTTAATVTSLSLTSQSLATILGSSIGGELPNSPSLLNQNNTLLSDSSQNSSVVSSLSPQEQMQAEVLTLQSQSIANSSLINMFAGETADTTKSDSLQSVPSGILDHHLVLCGQPSTDSVHAILPPGTVENVQNLTGSGTFTSAPSGSLALITSASVAPKQEEKIATGQTPPQTQSSLVEQVFLGLALQETTKTPTETTVTTNVAVAKAGEAGVYVQSKLSPVSTVDSTSVLSALSSGAQSTKLDMTKAAQTQQENRGKSPPVQTQQQQQQQQSPQQEKVAQEVEQPAQMQEQQQQQQQQQLQQARSQKVPTTSVSLPVPVAEISAAGQPNKVTVPSVPVGGQKKIEEGMVPQELTQMSDNDLLSYINPSCFDQV